MKNNNVKDVLTVTKDEIYHGKVDDNYIIDHNFEDYIDIFSYENLTLEYSFKTGQAVLYLQKSDEQYEMLYESSTIDGIENSSLYSKDGVYILNNYDHNTSSIERLDYLPKTTFIKATQKVQEDSKNTIINRIKTFTLPIYLATHATPLIDNDIYIKESSHESLISEYRQLFVKYESAKTLLPVANILEEVVNEIHEFIATGKYNEEKFNKSYSELQNFKDFCGSSISLLSSFIKRPYNTDLRALCDDIEKKMKNIDNLLAIYFEDELNLQNEEKNNDCK